MKRLLLLRHAKALDGADDANRPLALRGCDDAARLGHYLSQHGPLPDLVYCSTALRARQTADLVLEGVRTRVQYAAGLYLADEDVIEAFVWDGGRADCLAIVGHNPALAQYARQLVCPPENPRADTAFTTLNLHYPPGTLTVIDFDIDDWTDVASRRGRLVSFIRPVDLYPEH